MSGPNEGNNFGVPEVAVDGDVYKEQVIEQALVDKEAAESKEENKPPEATKEPDQFASKFAALTRKERAIKQREAELDARLAKMEAEAAERNKKYEGYDQLGQRIKNEPLKVLEENGITLEQLSEILLNDGKLTPEQQIARLKEEMTGGFKSELEQLKAQLAEKEAAAEEQKYASIIEGFKEEISDFVTETPETYELINANESVDLVYEVIEEHHKETGRVLSIKEAADQVEAYLEEEIKKYASLNKVKSLVGSKLEPKKEVQSSPTLSNTQTSQVSNNGRRYLSNEESLAEAAKHIKWND